MIESLDPEHVAFLVESYLVGLVECGVHSRSPITQIAGHAGADNSRNHASGRYFADDVVHCVANVESTVRATNDSKWIVQKGARCCFSIARITGAAHSGEGVDLRSSWQGGLPRQ